MIENDDSLEKENVIIFADETKYMFSRDEK